VECLAARRRAGIEHAHARLCVEQRRGELRAAVLDGDRAGFEAGQRLHGGRSFEHDHLAIPLDAMRFPTERAPRAQEIGGGHLRGIDAQDHRRMRVVGGKNRFGAIAPGIRQRLDQPARMRVTLRRIRVRGGQQLGALGDELAQYGVHETARAPLADDAARIDGEMHLGFGGSA
jgi:hypothetical protein